MTFFLFVNYLNLYIVLNILIELKNAKFQTVLDKKEMKKDIFLVIIYS